MLKGRRDSRISRAIDATEQLPTVNLTINQLNALFGSKGFSQHEMVTLSGTHANRQAVESSFLACDHGKSELQKNWTLLHVQGATQLGLSTVTSF